jgi:hypothetical protein
MMKINPTLSECETETLTQLSINQQAKYHWREFFTWTKETLPETARELLDGYGSKFQISFA